MKAPDTSRSGHRFVGIALGVALLPVPVALGVALSRPSSTPVAAPDLKPAAAPAVPTVPEVMPEPPPPEVVRKELAALTVEAPHSLNGYNRDKFEHWASNNRWPMTREVVLQRDGKDIALDAPAQAASTRWHSPYDDQILDAASEVHVDHVVPLANAWRSGADEWSSSQRHKFANDLSTSQLIAVSVVANREKGDQSPDRWTPPNADYQCMYGRAWTHVKFSYGLSVTEKEKTALESLVNTCS
ncbi:MAG: HNH endonuclease family protein [Streptomyces sp.]|uniref:HNH endonuclease family protein n=1 Tax=Streptomyces sp. TaxID=1931 RepID=UPI003D6AEC6A